MSDSATECWLPIPDWEGHYEISDLGRIRSVGRHVTDRTGQRTRWYPARPRKISLGTNGYSQVRLCRTDHGATLSVHRLVLLAFEGDGPEGAEVLHVNGNRTDARLVNLRWGTRGENNLDQVRHGTHPWARKTHCPRGHEYTPENTYIPSTRQNRKCRACMSRWKKKVAL